MLSDYQILEFGPGQEDAPWPYTCQLYFARKVEEAARAQAFQEAQDAMLTLAGDQVTRFDAQTAIRRLTAPGGARARLDKECTP